MLTLNPLTNQNAVQSFLKAAAQDKTLLVGLAIKVRRNRVVNWSFVKTDTLLSISAAEGKLSFEGGDDPERADQLKALLGSFSDDAPVLALMFRYPPKGASPEEWEFVDVNFLKSLVR